MSSVYEINRGIGTPLEFKGLKAQYIGWYAAMLLTLLIGFTVLYILGVSPYICVLLVFGTGGFGSWQIARLNKQYGIHGLKKLLASRKTPKALRIYNRKLFC